MFQCLPELWIFCNFHPIASSQFANAVVPAFAWVSNMSMRYSAKPGAPCKQSRAPPAVYMSGSFACKCPFVLSLEDNPIFSVMFASNGFATVSRSMHICWPIFIHTSLYWEHPAEHLTPRAAQERLIYLVQRPCPAGVQNAWCYSCLKELQAI